MHRIAGVGDCGGRGTAGETVEKRGDEAADETAETARRNRRGDD
ncbi:hypothetical protein [Haloferax denitrificans]|nr:hypothetical protein [Haloferax denitrificans]